jgi:hypothetical protein
MEPRVVATLTFSKLRLPDPELKRFWTLPVRIYTVAGRLLLEENASFDLAMSKRIRFGRPIRMHFSLVDVGHDPDMRAGCTIEVLPYSGSAGVGRIESVDYE